MVELSQHNGRTDFSTADKVSEGLKVCIQHGVHPAIVYMENAGVPRHIALRVLCSPEHFRSSDHRRVDRPNMSTAQHYQL